MNYKLIAYAQDFTAFLIQNLDKESNKIINIVLFGSVVRGQASKESDIDIFIDVTDKKIERKIMDIREKFYQSYKSKSYWNLLGVKNEIHCLVGKLKEWKSLQRSIISDGITLFGKYHAEVKTEQWYLFMITQGKSRKMNLSFWRTMYGYKQMIEKKKYVKEGLLKEYEGIKLARGVVIVPARFSAPLARFLDKSRIPYRLMPFWKERND